MGAAFRGLFWEVNALEGRMDIAPGLPGTPGGGHQVVSDIVWQSRPAVHAHHGGCGGYVFFEPRIGPRLYHRRGIGEVAGVGIAG